MVFNNTGKLEPNTFTYNNKNLENVKKYNYLGITFCNNGSFSGAKQVLYQKGLKAYFKFRKCFEHHKPKIKTLIHVFDHTIKPVLLYGSEVWGLFPPNKLSDTFLNKLCNELPAEKIHIKFCKYILEVSRRATNVAVRGELGRQPLFLEIIFNMIKYLGHLTSTDCTGIISDAYIESKNLHSENKPCWYKCVSEILRFFNIDINNIIGKSKYILKQRVFPLIIKKYKDIWKNELFSDSRSGKGGNKLRTYRLFKDKFGYEAYLNWGNFCQRRLITKFRISCHNLEIEQGRYKNVPADQRICKLCNQNVEDEIHFLLECNSLSQIRKVIIDEIILKYPNLNQLDNKQKFIWLFTAEENFIYSQLHLLLTKLFDARNNILNNIQN